MAKHMTDSSSTPSQEQIARRAYEIFIERGQPEGQDLEHWLEAERQLRAAGLGKSASQTATAATPGPIARNAAGGSVQRPHPGQWSGATRACRQKITISMPDKNTMQRARKDAREGKAPSTQAGEFVREEIEHVREGKHGVRSTKQAIAIGLSKARRAGVKLRPPAKGRTSEKTRKSAASAYRKGQRQSRFQRSARGRG